MNLDCRISYLSSDILMEMHKHGDKPDATDQAQARMKVEHRAKASPENTPQGHLNHNEGYGFTEERDILKLSDILKIKRKERQKELTNLYGMISLETRLKLIAYEKTFQYKEKGARKGIDEVLPYVQKRQAILESDAGYPDILKALGIYHHPYEKANYHGP